MIDGTSFAKFLDAEAKVLLLLGVILLHHSAPLDVFF
jgi:hypothetical protein